MEGAAGITYRLGLLLWRMLAVRASDSGNAIPMILSAKTRLSLLSTVILPNVPIFIRTCLIKKRSSCVPVMLTEVGNLDLGGNTLNATKLSMTYKDGTENVSGKTCAFANDVIDIKPKSSSSIQIVAKELQVVFNNVTINSEDTQSTILHGTSGGDYSEAIHSTLVMRN